MPSYTTSRTITIAVTLLAGALVLAGCASTGTAEPGAASSASTGFPVTIKGALGSTTIETKPTRVATVSWTNQDVAAALGIVPVTQPKALYGDDNTDGYLPWTYDALMKITGKKLPAMHDETDGIPFEKISSARPDVILGAYSGLSAEDFATLNKIAPTVGFPGKAWGTSWKDTTLVDAKALGKTAEAKAKIAEVEAKMKAEVAKYPALKGKTFAYLAVTAANPDVITYYTPSDARVGYVRELGLKDSPTVTKLSESNDQFYGTISAENADTIDADIVIIYVDDDKALDALKSSALLSQIPAIKRGSFVPMIDTTFILATSAPSLLSIPWALDKYVGLLGAAALKVG